MPYFPASIQEEMRCWSVVFGVDCSAFVRTVAIFSAAPVTDARGFCWFFLVVDNAVNLDRVFRFPLDIRNESCVAFYSYSRLACLTVLARSSFSCCINCFCRRVFSIIWSLTIFSSLTISSSYVVILCLSNRALFPCLYSLI